MADPRRIFRNFLNLGAAQAVAMASGFVTTVILGRALGPENFGILGFGVALLSFFGLAVVAGTDTYATREIARDHAGGVSLARRVLGLRAALVIAALAVLGVVVAWMDQPAPVKAVVLIQGIGVVSLGLLLDFYYQGVERMGIIAVRQSGAAALSLCAVLVLVRGPDDLYVAAAVPVCATLVAALAMMARFAGEHACFPIAPRPDRWGALLRGAAPFAVTGLMITAYTFVDIVMLGFMRTPQELGWYAAAARVMALGLVLGNLMGAAFLPSLAAARGGAHQVGAARNLARAALFVGMPVAAFGMGFSGEILEFLFGAPFRGGTAAMVVLMAAIGVAHVQIVFGTPLIGWNAEKTYTVAVTLAAGVNVVLNLLLIPAFGIVGAASATFASGVVAVVVLAHRFHGMARTLHLGLLGRAALAAAVALGVAIAAARGLHHVWADVPNVVVLVGAAAVFSAAYLGTAVVFGAGRPSELFGLMRGKGKIDAGS